MRAEDVDQTDRRFESFLHKFGNKKYLRYYAHQVGIFEIIEVFDCPNDLEKALVGRKFDSLKDLEETVIKVLGVY